MSLIDSQRLELPPDERAAASRPTAWEIEPLLEEALRAGVVNQLPQSYLRQLHDLELAIKKHDATLDPSSDDFDPYEDEFAEERVLLQALGMNPGRTDLFA